MAKTHRHLYQEMCSFPSLYQAFLQARQGKRYRGDILAYTHDLERNLLDLQARLLAREWLPGGFRLRRIYEPKPRDIRIAPFEDRVVHHALCNAIGPIFERTFIHDSYACREGKGSLAAVERLQQFLRRRGSGYVLSADVRKFFDSINHGVVLRELEWRIADADVLELCRRILASYASALVLAGTRDPKGIPIGNLTSQWFANIVGNCIDYHAKYVIGAEFYIRYMDNFLILGDDTHFLREAQVEMSKLLASLYLVLNPKTAIAPTRVGVPFLGFRVFTDHRTPRGENVRRGRRRLTRQLRLVRRGALQEEAFAHRLQSWFAYLIQGDSYRLRLKLADFINEELER